MAKRKRPQLVIKSGHQQSTVVQNGVQHWGGQVPRAHVDPDFRTKFLDGMPGSQGDAPWKPEHRPIPAAGWQMDRPRTKPDQVIEGLGLSKATEMTWKGFLTDCLSKNEIHFRAAVMAKSRELPGDVRRVVADRALSLYRTRQYLAKSEHPTTEGLHEALRKGLPTGGRYYRRTPNGKGGYKYHYDPDKYADRDDAHLSGSDVASRNLQAKWAKKGCVTQAEVESANDRYGDLAVNSALTALGFELDGDKYTSPADNAGVGRVEEGGDIMTDGGKNIAKGGGEGSRGGQVIGHSASGKPIYASNSDGGGSSLASRAQAHGVPMERLQHENPNIRASAMRTLEAKERTAAAQPQRAVGRMNVANVTRQAGAARATLRHAGLIKGEEPVAKSETQEEIIVENMEQWLSKAEGAGDLVEGPVDLKEATPGEQPNKANGGKLYGVGKPGGDGNQGSNGSPIGAPVAKADDDGLATNQKEATASTLGDGDGGEKVAIAKSETGMIQHAEGPTLIKSFVMTNAQTEADARRLHAAAVRKNELAALSKADGDDDDGDDDDEGEDQDDDADEDAEDDSDEDKPNPFQKSASSIVTLGRGGAPAYLVDNSLDEMIEKSMEEGSTQVMRTPVGHRAGVPLFRAPAEDLVQHSGVGQFVHPSLRKR